MISHLRPAQMPDWLVSTAQNGTLPLVLDVREPWELQTASVAATGFELLAIPMASIPNQLVNLDPARPVACLCHHGARSMQVANFLEQNGFTIEPPLYSPVIGAAALAAERFISPAALDDLLANAAQAL